MQTYIIWVLTEHSYSELVSDVMSEVSPMGVTVYDDFDVDEAINKEAKWAYYDDSLFRGDNLVKVEGFVYEEDMKETFSSLNERLATLRQGGAFVTDVSFRAMNREEDIDWGTEWQKYYRAIEVESFLIVPEFLLKKTNTEGFIPLVINPSTGFGTGEHETTRIALRALDKLNLSGKRVLDFGCGSGILGIGAIKKGASFALLEDISDFALENTSENVKLNDVSEKTIISNGLVEGVFDTIFANISDNVLLENVAFISEHLKKGGELILSGLQDVNVDNVRERYQKEGFDFIEEYSENVWRGMLLKKE